MNNFCLDAVERETNVAVAEILQVAAAASQTDEDVTAREQLYHVSMAEMIYQLLSYATDIKSSKLIDELLMRNVLLPGERRKIKEQKIMDAKVQSLMMMLREKTGDEFETFLTALCETGQQSIADTVRQALHSVGEAGQNPLQHARSMTA